MMPMTRLTGSPRRLSRSARMTGIPPATAASKSKSTPAASAAPNSSTPTLANSSLLAVTTGLPSDSAVEMSSRAGSMPPMTSTTRSTSGSLTTAWASRVRSPSASEISRSRERLRTATLTTSRRMPVRASMPFDCCAMSPMRAAPTFPQPSTPMRTTLPWDSTVVTVVKAMGTPRPKPRGLSTRRTASARITPGRDGPGPRRSRGAPPRATHHRPRRPRPVAGPCCSCSPSNVRRHR
ncbi:unannotated protein [freshwater metagenome]|uniref:Unannotated protein n=1 Tax=freshwater metagenome TaxID=449393 RepID=A0A6J6FFL7_9ZZZZ